MPSCLLSPVNLPYDLSTSAHDYPDWDGPPKRSIVICTHPRSGSTLLGEALYFAGDLGCPIEYLHAGFRPHLEAAWGVDDSAAFVREMWRRRTAPNGTLAVKLMWRDVQEISREHDPVGLDEIEHCAPGDVAPATYRRLADLLQTILPNPTSVHLSRRDRLRQAVSASVAVQTGQWRSIPGAEMPRAADPVYDHEDLTRIIAYADFCHGHWRNLIAVMPAPALSLTYEDLVRDYQSAVGDLLLALGSIGSPPPVRMQRQADQLSEHFVARYLTEHGVRTGA